MTHSPAAAPDAPATDASDTYGIDPVIYHRRWTILAVLCISLVTIVVAVSSLNVAIPTIIKQLGANSTESLWIIESYALVFAGVLLPAGALGDRFGRKWALLVGLVIFGVMAVVASQSGSPAQLIAARAVMGIGAALIMPATLSIIANVFPPHERQRAIATWAGLAGAGGAIGPLTSGAVLSLGWWWGAVFLVNVPLVLLLIGLTVWIVPNSSNPNGEKLDPLGALLSVAALGSLVFGIIEGPEWGWGSARVLGAFGVAVVAGVGFVVWGLRAREPMLDPRMFSGGLPNFVNTRSIRVAGGHPSEEACAELVMRANLLRREPAPATWSEDDPEPFAMFARQMFALANFPAKLTSFNPRAEIHGNETQPAADLKFETNVPSSVLDAFDPALRRFLYHKADDAGDLANQAHDAPNLRIPKAAAPMSVR